MNGRKRLQSGEDREGPYRGSWRYSRRCEVDILYSRGGLDKATVLYKEQERIRDSIPTE